MSSKQTKNWDGKMKREIVCDLCGKHIDQGECIDGLKQINITVIDDVTTDGEIYDLYKGNQLKKTTHYCDECLYEMLEGIKQVFLNKLDKMEADPNATHEQKMDLLGRLTGVEPQRTKKVQEAIDKKRELFVAEIKAKTE